jgi:hypothetical protein
LAAAGGIKLDKVLKSQESDIDTRKKIAEYMKKIQELAPKPAEGGGEFDNFSSAMLAAFQDLPENKKQEILELLPSRSTVLNTTGKPNLIRDKGSFEITGETKTGKKKCIQIRRPVYSSHLTLQI